ncbi:MAG: UDP-N-acetylglucosamine--N-acetylmuramyl-(pentapeptide) pyrophosphoryl-undecaprenol N-acetylglucosamine transferase [Phycisphaerae bacterium]
MAAQHYVFAGGGTGGHLYPGLAVADALCKLEPQAKITFFTTGRPLDRNLLERTPYAQVPQIVWPFTMRPWRWFGFWRAWRQSIAAARKFLIEHDVAAVLGLGGYAAGAPVVAAHDLGIRTAILNPDAVPGRANRFLGSKVDLVVMQWDVSRAYFGGRDNCHALGCPIRPAFADPPEPDAAKRFFDMDPARPLLLVTGASQGARTVNQTILSIWPWFAQQHPEWQLLHLTGPADEAEIRAGYARLGLNPPTVRVLAFTHDMPHALAAADAVVSRAGASTLAELTALGRPSILLPYPFHRDRHQHVNAQVLVDAGAAILVEDRRDAAENGPDVLAALQRLAEPATRSLMAVAAHKLGRPAAATDVAARLRGSSGTDSPIGP